MLGLSGPGQSGPGHSGPSQNGHLSTRTLRSQPFKRALDKHLKTAVTAEKKSVPSPSFEPRSSQSDVIIDKLDRSATWPI